MENIVKRNHISQDIHFRDADGDSPGVVSGRAIVFNQPSNFMLLDNPCDLEREIICPSAITKELLDSQRILLTAYHNPELILGASNYGSGTLKYDVRADGVYFECELPKTQHGQEIRELIKRGDISECSFVFSCPYFDPEYVEPRRERDEAGNTVTNFYVKKVTGIYDFTVCPFGAYSQTSCSARDNQALADYIKRTVQSLDEIPNKEDNDMTQEDINALAEKVADLIDERMRARECEKENKEKERSDEEPKEDETPKEEPTNETPKDDAPKEDPNEDDAPKEEPKDDEEKDRAYNQAIEMIKRSLDELA